jgi:hypothetical protein
MKHNLATLGGAHRPNGCYSLSRVRARAYVYKNSSGAGQVSGSSRLKRREIS